MTKTNTAPDAPADTRLMGIIHEALRRDLRRTRAALTETPAPDRHQREALAGHLGWMMQFLHAHHRTEDEGLYPMVRARDPHAAVLLDQMHDQHTAIAPAIAAVEQRAQDYQLADDRDDDQREQLRAAVDRLEDVLLPHLRREEDEVMPVVAAAITDSELRRWDHDANIRPKSLRQLGREGHWIIDGLAPRDRSLVLHLVPPRAPVRPALRLRLQLPPPTRRMLGHDHDSAAGRAEGGLHRGRGRRRSRSGLGHRARPHPGR